MRLLFLFTLAFITLNASDMYVKIGITKDQKDLKYVYSKLSKMKMKMSYVVGISGYEKIYTIYSGPYTSKKTQSIALKNVRYFFPKAKLVMASSQKEESFEKEDTEKIVDSDKNSLHSKKVNNSKYSLSVGLGFATAPSTHVIKSGSISIVEPKNEGINYFLNVGYDISDDYMFSLNYMRVDSSDLVFNNMYATFSYKFDKISNYLPHFGLSLGSSALSWNTSPLEQVSPGSNNDSETYIYGSEIGLSYIGYKNFSPFVHYHCMFMGHATNLKQDTVNTSKLEHKTLHTLLFGLTYNF